MLSELVFEPPKIIALLQAAGLSPADYPLGIAKLTWAAAVPDAAKRGELSEFIACIVAAIPAFGKALEDRLQVLRTQRTWYHHEDPYASSFVGPGASRAVIDRDTLRKGLHDLATDQYRILLVSGKKRTGKSHTWVLITHLRDAGRLLGEHRFVRVTAHDMADVVTGEDLVSSIADKLGLTVPLTPSGELPDARARKFLDMVVGRYPQGDGVTRWIILDGLDLPMVQDSARDVAKRLVALVAEGELPQTRLIVTGLDNLGPTIGYKVPVEQIPQIDEAQVRSFLAAVAAHVDRKLSRRQLDACVAKVLGTGDAPRDLYEVEEAVVRLARSWVEDTT
jgi:hypothetical protein